MWQRHGNLAGTSRHAIRDTCTQLLPLVEMYCKWELQEDCSDLRALMLRFDSETGLETHELGRSLLFMVRSDGVDRDSTPRSVPRAMRLNPFDVVRERLQTTALAIQELHTQVCPPPGPSTRFALSTLTSMPIACDIYGIHFCSSTQQPRLQSSVSKIILTFHANALLLFT